LPASLSIILFIIGISLVIFGTTIYSYLVYRVENKK
jgi:heme/copper-type cytochrome/quinol oxidase subunit 2